MNASPKMKAVIEQLVRKYAGGSIKPGSSLRLDMKGFDQLQIECYPNGGISVAHYFESQGQRIPEPNVSFWVDEQGRWIPLNIAQSMSGYTSYAGVGENGNIVLHNPEGQADLAEFCETWAQNLRDQKWIENAVKHEPPAGHLFELGQIVITPGALKALAGQSPDEFIQRHVSGDWGTLDPIDAQANDDALDGSARIFSAYLLSDQTKIWIITEWDRSVTTILLPEDY